MAEASLLDSARHLKNLYTEDDINNINFECIDQRNEFGLSRPLPIHRDLFASFSRTAHILGSTSIAITWVKDSGEKATIVMSGDLGNNTKENPYQPLLASRQGIFGYLDAIVVESTYGSGDRHSQCSNYDARISALRKIIQEEVFDKKALLIIPAFSIHRTQELLVDLYCVLKQYFSTDAETQSPIHILNPFYDEFESGSWNFMVQNSLKNAINKLPIKEQSKWLNSIVQLEPSDDITKSRFTLATDSHITVAHIKKLITQSTKAYPIDIKLDSNLARRMSSIYHTELCRPQIMNPDESLYRNRKMSERLGIEAGEQTDTFIKSIFPENILGDVDIQLGEHAIHYVIKSKTPKVFELQDRGCILITGSGMCNGGPVVSHLEKVIDAKRASTVLLTGYMAKNSLGERLMSHSNECPVQTKSSTQTLSVGNREVVQKDITTKVIQLQGYYSGHADQQGLLDFIFNVISPQKSSNQGNPATVFINHGHSSSRVVLKEAIQTRQNSRGEMDRSVEAIHLPDNKLEWYDLNSKQWIEMVPETRTESLLKELLFEQTKTNSLLQQLVERLGNQNSASNRNSKKK